MTPTDELLAAARDALLELRDRSDAKKRLRAAIAAVEGAPVESDLAQGAKEARLRVATLKEAVRVCAPPDKCDCARNVAALAGTSAAMQGARVEDEAGDGWEPDPEAFKSDGSWREQRRLIQVPSTRTVEANVWTSNGGKTWCWHVYDRQTDKIAACAFDCATEDDAKRAAESAAGGGR